MLIWSWGISHSNRSLRCKRSNDNEKFFSTCGWAITLERRQERKTDKQGKDAVKMRGRSLRRLQLSEECDISVSFDSSLLSKASFLCCCVFLIPYYRPWSELSFFLRLIIIVSTIWDQKRQALDLRLSRLPFPSIRENAWTASLSSQKIRQKNIFI